MIQKRTTSYITLLLASIMLATLPGCAAFVAGAAGGTAAALHDRRSTQTILDDETIENSAVDKLYKDQKLQKKIHINVTSYNGIVLVSGEVLTKAARARAVEIVRHIPKVRRVHNELVVADLASLKSRTSDTWLTSKVKTSMLGTKNLDASRVKVVTENSTVFLMGMVTEQEANQAVDIARHTKGVQRVVKLFEYVEPDKPKQQQATPAAPKTTPGDTPSTKSI